MATTTTSCLKRKLPANVSQPHTKKARFDEPDADDSVTEPESDDSVTEPESDDDMIYTVSP